MKDIYRWGILGPGRIAHKMAQSMAQSPRAKLYAVASRSADRAQQFAAKYQVPKAYDSYEALAKDPEIDAIYIASPHPMHLQHSQLCLEQGKAVLCEKPLGLNRSEVNAMCELAKARDTFFMEAIWTRFHPNTLKVLEWISEGKLGKVKYLRADFGFYTDFDPNSRLYNMDLGGGAILDIGIYPLFLAQLILGIPQEVMAMANLSPTGSDETCSMLLRYADGVMAHCHATVAVDTNIEAEIYGTEARIMMHNRFHEPGKVSLWKRNELLEEVDFPSDHGYRYELEEVMSCLDAGLKESPMLNHDFSKQLIDTMDEVRRMVGVRYASDPY